MSEPEKVLMPRYRCVHCRRSWANRAIARQHAERCWFDPANRGCKTCAHFTRDYHGEDICAAEVELPVVERYGRTQQTLLTGCASHRVLEDFVNPDVLDALDDAASTAT